MMSEAACIFYIYTRRAGDDEGGHRVLGVELVAGRDRKANASRVEEAQEGRLIFGAGAGGKPKE